MEPLLPTRPDLESPDGAMRCWFTRPSGMVDMLVQPHFSNDVTAWLTGPATDQLRARFGAERLLFLHDWRAVRSYDLAARGRLVTWGLSMGNQGISAIRVLLAPESPALVKMACAAGRIPFVMAGISMTVESDSAALVKELSLRAA